MELHGLVYNQLYNSAMKLYNTFTLGLHLASMVHEYAVTQDPSVMVCVYVSFTINLYEWECIIGSGMGNSRSTGHDDCLHWKTWLLGTLTSPL